MQFHFKDKCRCQWVHVTNGIIKALFAPIDDATKHPEFLLVNMTKDRGVPEIGKEYLVEISPSFPHRRST